MKQFLMQLCLLLLVSGSAMSQIIWTEPTFPTGSDEVTVYFDATQGTGGLENCNCDVYLHTGVITTESTGPSDWKNVQTDWGVANPDWRMTPVSGQPNVYSYVIGPSINEYYGVGGNIMIEQMAFVFRNGNGSLEGKGDGGTDIYYTVYPEDAPFSAILTSPTMSGFFANIGDDIIVNLTTSEEANIRLFQENILLTEIIGTELDFTIPVTEIGTKVVEIIANNGVDEVTNSFSYTVVGANEIEALPAGLDVGINYIDESTILFALEAPNKSNVFLIGDFNNWLPFSPFQMKNTPDGNIWWIQIENLTPGEEIRFQYLVDGEIRIADPYSELILDPWNDPWIPEETYPNLLDYPTGQTTGIVGVAQPGAPEYNWQTTNYERPEQNKLIIYELLMRDFLEQPNYQTLLDTLDYLERLGINAIEFMPVNEFSGNNSWGYNPTFHGALDKYYGTKDAFKRVIDACHARGIAVILDVVFNHAHEHNPLAALYWDDNSFRPAADSPYMNQEAPHNFSVFFDYNHDSPLTQAYVERIMKYWLEEYRVDGFRFDLSKGLTQNESGPFDAGTYDFKRIALLKRYADVMWETTPGAYVILEHFAANNEETELSNYGCMLWGGAGTHNQYLEAALGAPSNLIGANYQVKGWNDAHLIAYMESHDEERMQYKNSNFGGGSGDYQIQELATGLDRCALASTFYYTIPGPKMLWQFGELGYDFSINYCENGTISNNCRTNPKPIRWDYLNNPDRVDLYNTVRALNWLRANYDVFHTDDFSMKTNEQNWKRIHLNSTDMKVTVVGNFGVTEQNIDPDFQQTGTWYEFFSGEALAVNDVNLALNMAPGEYRIYFDQPIDRPNFVTSTAETIASQFDFSIAPNPADGAFMINYTLPQSARVAINIFDVSGKLIQNDLRGDQLSGNYRFEVNQDFAPGIYFVQLQIDGQSEVHRLVIGE